MKLSYLVIEAQFENDEEIKKVEAKYDLSVVNMTKFYIEDAEIRDEAYYGPDVYCFIGRENAIKQYLVWGYRIDDLDEFNEVVTHIKGMEV